LIVDSGQLIAPEEPSTPPNNRVTYRTERLGLIIAQGSVSEEGKKIQIIATSLETNTHKL